MARRRKRFLTEPTEERQPAGTSWSPDHPKVLETLAVAKVVQCRPIMWGSNGTFLVTLDGGEELGQSHAVYKPRRGEAPLWDFPHGTLHRREVATFLVSECLGWSLVPATVIRDGPFGVGSVQLFIEHDPANYFSAPAKRDREASQQIALLDVVLNNADRKAEHCIQDLAGRTWAIDHGLTFHVEPKLRTVIWDFAGDRIRQDLLDDLENLRQAFEDPGSLRSALCGLVTQNEVDAVYRRLKWLLRNRIYPDPGKDRRASPWANWWP